jgi:hypothetical protein
MTQINLVNGSNSIFSTITSTGGGGGGIVPGVLAIWKLVVVVVVELEMLVSGTARRFRKYTSCKSSSRKSRWKWSRP